MKVAIASVVAVAALLAAGTASAAVVDRTVACTTSTASGFSSFQVDYDPAAGGGWFALSIVTLTPLVEVGSGRGFKVNGSKCRSTKLRAPLTRRGIRGAWLVYRSGPTCVVPGRAIVHVRGTVSSKNLFTGQVAVRMAPSGLRVAFATFDAAGTARAFVSSRCSTD